MKKIEWSIMAALKGISAHWFFNVVAIIAPVALIPILIRRIGVSEYAVLALIQVILGGITTIVDFGFCVSGQKILAETKSAKERDIAIADMVFIHFILWVICVFFGGGYLAFSGNSPKIFGFLFGAISVLLVYIPPVYVQVYLGDQFGYGMIGSVFKVLHALVVILFIDSGNWDFLYFGSMLLFSILSSIWLLFRLYRLGVKLSFRWPFCVDIIKIFREGGGHFVRRFSSLVPSLGVPILLGAFGSKFDLAIYSLVDKFRILIWQIVGPILHYYAGKIFSLNDMHEVQLRDKLILKVFLIVFILACAVSAFCYFAGNILLGFIGNGEMSAGIINWKIGAVSMIIGALAAFSGVILFPLLKNSAAHSFLLLGFSIFVLVVYSGLFTINAVAGQIVMLIIDFVFVTLAFFMVKRKLMLFKHWGGRDV